MAKEVILHKKGILHKFVKYVFLVNFFLASGGCAGFTIEFGIGPVDTPVFKEIEDPDRKREMENFIDEVGYGIPSIDNPDLDLTGRKPAWFRRQGKSALARAATVK